MAKQAAHRIAWPSIVEHGRTSPSMPTHGRACHAWPSHGFGNERPAVRPCQLAAFPEPSRLRCAWKVAILGQRVTDRRALTGVSLLASSRCRKARSRHAGASRSGRASPPLGSKAGAPGSRRRGGSRGSRCQRSKRDASSQRAGHEPLIPEVVPPLPDPSARRSARRRNVRIRTFASGHL